VQQGAGSKVGEALKRDSPPVLLYGAYVEYVDTGGYDDVRL
jgi:hypothetical protein